MPGPIAVLLALVLTGCLLVGAAPTLRDAVAAWSAIRRRAAGRRIVARAPHHAEDLPVQPAWLDHQRCDAVVIAPGTDGPYRGDEVAVALTTSRASDALAQWLAPQGRAAAQVAGRIGIGIVGTAGPVAVALGAIALLALALWTVVALFLPIW